MVSDIQDIDMEKHDCFKHYKSIGGGRVMCDICTRIVEPLRQAEEFEFEFEVIKPDHKPMVIGDPMAGTKILQMVLWKPIESAPWNQEVMLTGESGMIRPHDTFICNGYRQRDWHGGRWNDIQGTPLEDAGQEPTHWAEKINLPNK